METKSRSYASCEIGSENGQTPYWKNVWTDETRIPRIYSQRGCEATITSLRYTYISTLVCQVILMVVKKYGIYSTIHFWVASMVLGQPYDLYVVPVKWPEISTDAKLLQNTTQHLGMSKKTSHLSSGTHYTKGSWIHNGYPEKIMLLRFRFVMINVMIFVHMQRQLSIFAQLWSDLIIRFHVKILCIFTSFGLWPPKSFVKWAHVLDNVVKREVTGCIHFQDPALETEYNSFA